MGAWVGEHFPEVGGFVDIFGEFFLGDFFSGTRDFGLEVDHGG